MLPNELRRFLISGVCNTPSGLGELFPPVYVVPAKLRSPASHLTASDIDLLIKLSFKHRPAEFAVEPF